MAVITKQQQLEFWCETALQIQVIWHRGVQMIYLFNKRFPKNHVLPTKASINIMGFICGFNDIQYALLEIFEDQYRLPVNELVDPVINESRYIIGFLSNGDELLKNYAERQHEYRTILRGRFPDEVVDLILREIFKKDCVHLHGCPVQVEKATLKLHQGNKRARYGQVLFEDDYRYIHETIAEMHSFLSKLTEARVLGYLNSPQKKFMTLFVQNHKKVLGRVAKFEAAVGGVGAGPTQTSKTPVGTAPRGVTGSARRSTTPSTANQSPRTLC